MLDQIASAFDRQDYRSAAQLLKQLRQQSPESPWIALFTARLQEVSGKTAAAEALYRQILRQATSAKLATQAREGLHRLAAIDQAQRQQAIAEATADPANAGVGFLVIEPISSENRQAAAQQFGQIMNLDAYTARLMLPSRGWRLYRTGNFAELQVYGQELRKAGIPVFWVSLARIQSIRVFRVHCFQTIDRQATIVCQNEADQLGMLQFDWSEVATRVEGRLPIFEDVVDVGAYNKLMRKEQTQDFVQLLDLHLPQRHCILRLCDRTYHFHEGIELDPLIQTTPSQISTRLRWNTLLDCLGDRLSSTPLWSDFTVFADSALEHLDLVKGLPSHIDVFRKAPTNWDPAFHLYSTLVFAQDTPRH
jgi:hypothetical protein